jgi:hypothetical protein
MDNVIKNYEEVLEKPPSTRLFLKFLKHKISAKRAYKKYLKEQKPHKEKVENLPPEGIEISSFAIVLDGVVVDVMNVQKEFGEILKKGPSLIFIDEGEHRPHEGWIYRNDKFMPIEDLISESHITLRG